MARLCYAPDTQFAQFMLQSGLSGNKPPANAFSMLAHTPAVGASVLCLVLLTETDLDPKIRELVILRSNPAMRWPIRVGPARCHRSRSWRKRRAGAR